MSEYRVGNQIESDVRVLLFIQTSLFLAVQPALGDGVLALGSFPFLIS